MSRRSPARSPVRESWSQSSNRALRHARQFAPTSSCAHWRRQRQPAPVGIRSMRRSLRRPRQVRRLRHRRPSNCGAWATSCDGEPRLRVPKERMVGEYRPWRWSRPRLVRNPGQEARGSANPRPASCRARRFPRPCRIRAGCRPRFRCLRDLPHPRQAQRRLHPDHRTAPRFPAHPAHQRPNRQTQSHRVKSGLSSPGLRHTLLHLGPHPLGPSSHHSYIPQAQYRDNNVPKNRVI